MVHRRPFDRGENLTLPVIPNFRHYRNHQRYESHREGDRQCDMPVCKHKIGRHMSYARIDNRPNDAEQQRNRKGEQGG